MAAICITAYVVNTTRILERHRQTAQEQHHVGKRAQQHQLKDLGVGVQHCSYHRRSLHWAKMLRPWLGSSRTSARAVLEPGAHRSLRSIHTQTRTFRNEKGFCKGDSRSIQCHTHMTRNAQGYGPSTTCRTQRARSQKVQTFAAKGKDFFNSETQNRAARGSIVHYKDRIVGMLTEERPCHRYRLSLEFRLSSTADTDFGREPTSFCSNIGPTAPDRNLRTHSKE